MANFRPVDRVEVHVLVDNVTDSLSTVPSHVENEWSYLWRHGMRKLSGRCICCAAHGLSCLITAYRGESMHTILFDTGPEGDTFERNISRLGVDLGTVEGIVLSHGHWDHAGGMLRALDLIRERNGGREVPFYAHPGMYATRAMKQPDGSMRLMEDIPSVEALTAHGAKVINTTEPQTLSEEMFYVSGEIPRVTTFEHGFPGQYRQTDDGS
jgi:7,8-dihydropterin-6-yl-methyl-4-(beta-D-ribofuranosyl)aminobenzene 5'-phosphate synthase